MAAMEPPRPQVLIDAQRLRAPNTGLGQVALHLGRQFLSRPSARWTPVFLLPAERLDAFGVPVAHEIASLRRRLLPRLAPRYALWHALHQDATYLPARGDPFVLTIHDLNFLGEKSPRKAARRLARVQRLVDRASALTVISEYTRGVVTQHLDVGGREVEVIYNGLCTDIDGAQARPERAPPGEFLFSLGVVRAKKNFKVLVDLIARIPDVGLVIAGNTDGDYAPELERHAARLGVADRVFLIGEVSDEQKHWLFRHCRAFVFPSLYEGFGLPLLEAMSFGVPTFSAATSSLPEVGGHDIFYWDDFSPQHMLDVYRTGIAVYDREPDRLQRLRARAETFSWVRSAERYAALYERLLAQRAR
jgi:glycosyltransferase involved in cell wall biosynthesis